VGIFTCALKDYADIILEHLPVISVRLYRQHAVKIGKELVKDLSRVGRDLSRVILVDNLEKNFKLQKQNGIHVRSWFGDPNDNVLKELQAEFESFIRKNPDDVRVSEHRRSFL
jgi:CTD small phosphatase-like protein 2